MTARGISKPLTRNLSEGVLSRLVRWTPARLFQQGQQGVWYEPTPQYLYQDSAGTTPVTADGDPVGYMQDLSGNGNHATQSTAASKPIYRTDGALHWLEFDGVDDRIFMPTLGISGADNRTAIWGGGFPSLQLGGYEISMPAGSRWSFRNLSNNIRIELGGSGYTTSLASTATAINTCLLNGSTLGDHVIYQNGQAEQATGVDAVNTRDETHEIGRAAADFQPSIMRALILVSVALPEAERTNAESYVADQSGVTL